MKDLEIRFAIAKSLGWKHYPSSNGWVQNDQPVTFRNALPNWPIDLNEAIKLCDVLSKEGWEFEARLKDSLWDSSFRRNEAGTFFGTHESLTLAICKAFLFSKGLWIEETT